ncbi:MAG TPA: L-lactate permease [Stellaceae bacterium]|nr:L-lactate permease [Stellaceae bacterium]
MLGWLGVALTGSDTASNVLFGGLQKITSRYREPRSHCAAVSTAAASCSAVTAN